MRAAATYRAARRNAARKRAYVPLRDLRKVYGYTHRQMRENAASICMLEAGAYA